MNDSRCPPPLPGVVVEELCLDGTNQTASLGAGKIEQLHAIAPLISPSTSNATLPQWQLCSLVKLRVLAPWCFKFHAGWFGREAAQ